MSSVDELNEQRVSSFTIYWRPTWADSYIRTMSEEILRLHAKRAGNRGVVTKLIGQVETIFAKGPEELDAKTRDQPQRIDAKLSEKLTLLFCLF